MRRLLRLVQRAIAEGGARLKNGYIRLYRGLLEHPLVMQLPAAWFRIFIVILLKVNWKPGTWWNGNKNVEIQPGQLVTSVDKLSKAARASSKETRGLLGYLQRANIAAIETANRYSIITVLNWETYQNSDEPEGKLDGKVEGNQRANEGQTEGKLAGNNQINQEGKKGKREENVIDKTDTSLASRKNGAKTSEAPVDVLMQDDHRILTEAIALHFGERLATKSPLWPSGYREPECSITDQVLKFVTHNGVAAFCDHLRTLPARYQRGGSGAPRGFPWYVTKAQDWARKSPLQKPTEERCQHGKEYGICCVTPEEFDRMTDSFSTLASLDEPREGAA
jgi:hypothetical protein